MTTDIETRGPAVTLADVEEISARQNEPAWLRERRLEAWRLYESMDLPDPGDEQWRRTDVRALDLDGLRAAPAITNIEALPAAARAAGVRFMPLRAAVTEHEDLVRRRLYAEVAPGEWKYLALNAALWQGGSFLLVPRGVEVDVPVQLLTSGNGALLIRTLVIAEANSAVRLIDESESPDGPRTFVSAAVEIFVGDGAKVEYYDLNRWGDGVYNFKTVRATLGRDAQFLGMAAGIGSKLTKMRFDTLLPEPGARSDLLGVTFANGDQHFDYNTLQDHSGKHTQSDLQFKAALDGRSSLVWYGVTHIRHSAGGSAANQTSRNLLLSEHAKAAPIPILEIEAYDVERCSHGATAGPVDENELFYLQSRAIPHEVAERMLVEGYLADVIGRVPDPRVRARIMRAVLEKMGGGTDSLSSDDVLGAA
ncbi:MAG: SufD family Fe-S cluster assembly protein [Dehalococcoidia bacterium]